MADQLTVEEAHSLRQRHAGLAKGKGKHPSRHFESAETGRTARGSSRARAGGVRVIFDGFTDSLYRQAPKSRPKNACASPRAFLNSPASSSDDDVIILDASPSFLDSHGDCSTAGTSPEDEAIAFVEPDKSSSRGNRYRTKAAEASTSTINDAQRPVLLPFPSNPIIVNPRPRKTPPRYARYPLPLVLPCSPTVLQHYRNGNQSCADAWNAQTTRQHAEKLHRFPLQPRLDATGLVIVDTTGSTVLEDFSEYRRATKDHLLCLRRRNVTKETFDRMTLVDTPPGQVMKHVQRQQRKSSSDWGFLPEAELVWGAEPWWNSNAWEEFEKLRREAIEDAAVAQDRQREAQMRKGIGMRETHTSGIDITTAEGRFSAWAEDPVAIARIARSQLRKEKRDSDLRRGLLDVDMEI